MQRGTQPLKLTLLAASVLLFAWSLTCVSYYTEGGREGASAFLSLLTGWLGILNGGFSWLANPPLALAWLCLLLWLASMAVALTAACWPPMRSIVRLSATSSSARSA